ncbi:glycosyltransferase [Mitsuaria sp. WAJ17]|uniref:glycosyltransferase n=1 Tax=Mitsuaria sp. WAJ17 TaxID=2761452 RepID=UPI001C7EE03A|nr:glycosyltransferase [Mitsuaria sp. WAJ17]
MLQQRCKGWLPSWCAESGGCKKAWVLPSNAVIKTPSGEVLRANDPDKPVITYVARNLEPYRGFHTFMRALPAVQREHKNAHVVIVGGDEVSYGARPKDAKNWREKMLAEVGSQLDPTRTHFVGKVPYADYKRVLQVSAAHVYLTYPFVLSWSCLEAMATGCRLVASEAAPVREVVPEGMAMCRPLDAGALVTALSQASTSWSGPSQERELLQATCRDVRHRYGKAEGLRQLDPLIEPAERARLLPRRASVAASMVETPGQAMACIESVRP